jgi:hypothetical protein
MELSEYEINSLNKLEKTIVSGQWSNDGLVKLIELAGEYLNISTISNYAKKNNMQYQGAMKDTAYRKNVTIFDVKFIIDNN